MLTGGLLHSFPVITFFITLETGRDNPNSTFAVVKMVSCDPMTVVKQSLQMSYIKHLFSQFPFEGKRAEGKAKEVVKKRPEQRC